MNTNFTPIVQIVTWFLLITCSLSIVARGVTKAASVRSITLDDYFISVSWLFALVQSVIVSLQTLHGYGKPFASARPAEVEVDLKLQYVAALVYISSLCFAKLAVLALIKIITPLKRDRAITYGLALIVALWAFSGEFAAAFVCKLPRPWNYLEGNCPGHYSWWTYFEISNILTDTALIALPFGFIWRIQAPMTKKASALSFFAFRIIVIGAAACKLVFLQRTRSSDDPLLDSWTVTVCTQTIQCLSIVSACFLYLKPFLDSIESGFISNEDMRRQATIAQTQQRADTPSALNASFAAGKTKRAGITTIGLRNMAKGRHATTITAGHLLNRDETGSQDSQSRIIKETRTFSVEESNGNSGRSSADVEH